MSSAGASDAGAPSVAVEPVQPVEPGLAALLAPIAGGAPVGRDLSYEPSFERLAAEVDRSATLAGELPDWRLVETESARILREESKDLRAAAWLAAARAHSGGWPGAADGLAAYQAVAEAFWEAMFPPVKRARARAALAGWLWESVARALASRKPTLADAPSVQRVETLVAAVDAAHAARLGDANPGAGVLRALVRQTLRDLPEPPPPPRPSPEPDAARAGSSGATPSSSSAPASPRSGEPASPPVRSAAPVPGDAAAPGEVPAVASLDEAEAAADRWRTALSTLARHARESSPASPWPYRLARVSAWLVIESAPDVENGRTFVRPPRPADRAALDALAGDGSWEALRDAAEDALSEHIFWLDLHRLSATALERLGPSYASARAAVGREVTALLERVPSLPTLSFANATPFASPETLRWLAEEKARFSPGSAAVSSGAHAHAGDDGAGAITDAARAALAAGSNEAALAEALSAAAGLPRAQGRFRARLGVAQLAATRGMSAVALALFEQLLAEATPTLEAWEPALCVEVLEGCLKAMRAARPPTPRHPNGGRDEEGVEDEDRSERATNARERQTLLLRRLLSLDPAAALRSWG